MKTQYHIVTLTLIQVFICPATLQKNATELPIKLQQLHNNKESIDVTEQVFVKNENKFRANESETFEGTKQNRNAPEQRFNSDDKKMPNILEKINTAVLKNSASTITSQKTTDLPSDSDVPKKNSPLNIENKKKESVEMHENIDKMDNIKLSLTQELISDMETSESAKNSKIFIMQENIKSLIPDKKVVLPFPMANEKYDSKDLLAESSILKIQKPSITKLRLEKNGAVTNILTPQDGSHVPEIKTPLTKFSLPKNILKSEIDSLTSKLVDKISHLQNKSNIISNLKSHKLGDTNQSLFEKKELPIKTFFPGMLQSSDLLHGESKLKIPIISKTNDTRSISKLIRNTDIEHFIRKKDELKDLLAEGSSSSILKTQLPSRNFSILETNKMAENQLALLNFSHVLEKIKSPLKNPLFLKSDVIPDMHASGTEIKMQKDNSEIIKNNNEDNTRSKDITEISKLPNPSDVIKKIQSTRKNLQPDTSILKQSLLKELKAKASTESKTGDSTFLTKLMEDTKSDRLTQKIHKLKDSLANGSSGMLKTQMSTLDIKRDNQSPLFNATKILEKIESPLSNDTTFDMETSESEVKNVMIQSDDPTAFKHTDHVADILKLPKPINALKKMHTSFEKKQPIIKTLPDTSILKQSLLEELKAKTLMESKINDSTFLTKLTEDIKSDRLIQKVEKIKNTLTQGSVLKTQLPMKNIPILEIRKDNQSTPFNISHIMKKIKSPLLKSNIASDMQASESKMKSTILKNENNEDEKSAEINNVANVLKLPRSSDAMQKINSLLEKKQTTMRDLQIDTSKFPTKNISVSEIKKIAENRLESFNVSNILEKSKSLLKNSSLLKNKVSSDMQVSESKTKAVTQSGDSTVIIGDNEESMRKKDNVLTLPKSSDIIEKIQSSLEKKQSKIKALQPNTSILKQTLLEDLKFKTNNSTLLKKPFANTNSHKLTQKINELKDSLAESNSSILQTQLPIKNIPMLDKNNNQLTLLNASDLLKKIKAPLLKNNKSDMEGSESETKCVTQSNDGTVIKANHNENGEKISDILKLPKLGDTMKKIHSSLKTQQFSDQLEVLKLQQPTLKNFKFQTPLTPINLNNPSSLTKFRESTQKDGIQNELKTNSSDAMEILKNKLELHKKVKEHQPLSNIVKEKLKQLPAINKNLISDMQASASELKNKVLSKPTDAFERLGSLLEKTQPIIKNSLSDKLKQSQLSLRKPKSLLKNENDVPTTTKAINNVTCHNNDTNDLLTSSSNIMEKTKLLKETSSISDLGKQTNHSLLPNVSDVLKKIKSPSEILTSLKAKPLSDMQSLSSNLKNIIDTNTAGKNTKNENKEIDHDGTEALKVSEGNIESKKMPTFSKEKSAVNKFFSDKSEILQSLRAKLKPKMIPSSLNRTTSKTNKPEDLLAQNSIPEKIKVLFPIKNISMPLRQINKENLLAKSLNISAILEKVKKPLKGLEKLKNISASDMQVSQSEIKEKFRKYRNNNNMTTNKIKNDNENENHNNNSTDVTKSFNTNNALKKNNSLLKEVSPMERFPLDILKVPQSLLTQLKLLSTNETKIKQNNDSKNITSSINSSDLPTLSSLRQKNSLLQKHNEPTDLLPLSSIPRSKVQSPLRILINKKSEPKEELPSSGVLGTPTILERSKPLLKGIPTLRTSESKDKQQSSDIPQISTILQRMQSPLQKLSALKKNDMMQSSPSNIKKNYIPADDKSNTNSNFQGTIASLKDSLQSNIENLKNKKSPILPSTSNLIPMPNKLESTKKFVPNMLKPLPSELQKAKNIPFKIPDISEIMNNKKSGKENNVRDKVTDLLRNSKSPVISKKFLNERPILSSILDSSRLPKSYTNRKNPLQEIFNKKNVNNNDAIGKMKQNLREFQSKIPNPFLKQDTMQSLPSMLKEAKIKQPLLFQNELPLKEKLLSKISRPSSSSMLKNIFQNDNLKSKLLLPNQKQDFELFKPNKKSPMEESGILKSVRAPNFSSIQKNPLSYRNLEEKFPEKKKLFTGILKTPQKPDTDLFSNKNNLPVLKKNLNLGENLKPMLRGQEDNQVLKNFEGTVLKAMNTMDKAVRNVSNVFSSGIKKFKILANDVTNKMQHMSNQETLQPFVKSSPNYKQQSEDNVVQASNVVENYAMCKNLFKSMGDLDYDLMKNTEDDQEIDDQIISENNEHPVYIDPPRNNLRQNQLIDILPIDDNLIPAIDNQNNQDNNLPLPLPDISALDPANIIQNLDNIERSIERFAMFLNIADRINQYVSNKVNDISSKISAFTRTPSTPLI